MRIIAGKWRGRPIASPKDNSTRPTTDRIREALFSKLDARGAIADAKVLDLFAGTGALGLEALSRGAKSAVFVEQAAGARGVIRENIEALGAQGITKLLKRDATNLGPMAGNANGPFSLLFSDAPYQKDLTAPALQAALEGGWLTDDALCVVELDKRESLELPAGFTLDDERVYGDTKILLLVLG